jgi:hypothetical protein
MSGKIPTYGWRYVSRTSPLLIALFMAIGFFNVGVSVLLAIAGDWSGVPEALSRAVPSLLLVSAWRDVNALLDLGRTR